jgi:L-iditol 2-dehydrogenase
MKVQSKAFVYYGPGDVRSETRTIECGPQDLLVRIRLCGRCGTDATIYRQGHPRVDPNAPVVLGHELVGEIVAVGEYVRSLREGIGYMDGRELPPEYLDFQPGERIVVQGRIARYRNGLMLMADPIDNLSFYFDGGYSQYMRVPPVMIRSASVLRVAEGVSDEAAALAEPTACALESIFSTPHPTGADAEGRHIFRAGVARGGRACVIGSGTVSLIYARLIQLEGAAEVFILVRSPEKAALARQLLGPDVRPVNVAGKSDEEIVAELTEATGGQLFDDVVAACADPGAQRLMLDLYNPDGYAVGACFGGTHQRVDRANVDSHHYRIAKTVGTSGCSTRTLETVLRWLEDGRLALDGFASPRLWTLDDAPHEFFTARDDGRKPMLRPWGGVP